MVRYRVKVYQFNSQSVYTVFFLESRISEILYLIDCIAMSLNRLGYRIVAEQCQWLKIWCDLSNVYIRNVVVFNYYPYIQLPMHVILLFLFISWCCVLFSYIKVTESAQEMCMLRQCAPENRLYWQVPCGQRECYLWYISYYRSIYSMLSLFTVRLFHFI